ncbi:FG-GAP-like repeat-containing protein [Rhodohalobacter sulfatireducens]|uniref:FG-GAP-like repeat-containing protein n=1 Tax=Rhodohalobacter sulfatireducens TaxID=2911366 RepID=UPI001EDBB88D
MIRFRYIHITIPVIFIFIFGILLSGCNKSTELNWKNEDGYRWSNISTEIFGSTGFKSLPSSHTGIGFINIIKRSAIDKNRHYLNGSGVAAGDVDGDGLTDLYFSGLSNPNKLYKNVGGMKFEDITAQAGVTHEGVYSTGATFADVNGNGHLDLLVTAMHGNNTLYINDGTGKFTLSEESGLGAAKGSNTMALADISGNGYPDLYITRYKEQSVKDIYTTEELAWENILKEPFHKPTDSYTLVPPFDKHYELVRQDGELVGITELGEVDELYYNNGGEFEKVLDTAKVFLDEDGKPFGLQPDWGLTAKFHDLNSDGLEDLYVCNDFHTPDRIWINQGDGTFKAIGWQAIRNLSYSCMAVDFSDVNRDERVDIFTTEMLDTEHHRRLSQASSEDHVAIPIGDIQSRPMHNRNSMYIQREDETFAETSWISGVPATGWSWATRFMDIDLDGFEDLIVATGYLYNILDIDAQYTMIRNRRNMDEHFMEFVDLVEPLELRNQFLRNNGISSDPKFASTFTNVSDEWGFKDQDISQGMALVDLNNDGALDIVMNRMNKEVAIYENTTKASRIAVRLKGSAPNTQALGSKVSIKGGPVVQEKQISAGGDYASGSDLMIMFAADPNNSNHQINIIWPDGSISKLDNVKANRIYEISESEIEILPSSENHNSSTPATSLFKDISENIGHSHHEDYFEDFYYQPLLPFKLSQQGPGLAWLDIFKNNVDDLLISSGKGGSLAIYENLGDGEFRQRNLEGLTELAKGDQTAIVGWEEENFTRVFVGSSNYERGTSYAPSVYNFKIYEDGTVLKDSVRGSFSTTGPVTAADITENGYPDLFIGGNFKPGQYPANANSRFIRNQQGKFESNFTNSQLIEDLGLVTGAVFSDFNRDGKQELLISREWGSLKLLESKDGTFIDKTKEMDLDKYTGVWKGVSTGDFNNDGLPDIVAANIGLNTPYQIHQDFPIRIYYQNLIANRRMEIIESYADEEGNYLPRRRLYNFLEQQIMLNKMENHEEFSSSTLQEIFGNGYQNIPFKTVNTLQSMVFINTSEGFEAHPLPQVAQFTMAFHPAIGDFNNDGNEDLFLSQNFFAVNNSIPRMDSGRGLLLNGDGKGNFYPIPGSESGIKMYGEQRGAAISDINADGRADLVVSQNGAQTKLFLNQAKRAGYTVKLHGPATNRDAIGSSIRLVYQNGTKGPRREVQSGGGYWAQNSYTQILGASNQVKEIEINWFDNTNQTIPITDGERTYNIYHQSNDEPI